MWFIRGFIVGLLLLINTSAFSASNGYGSTLCHSDPQFLCYKVKHGDSWEKLFPNAQEQDTLMRINRLGIKLRPGMVLAIPRNFSQMDMMSFAPFPTQISAPGENIVLISTVKLAWGAYTSDGRLLRWGPISGGRGYCPDTGHACHTIKGKFAVNSKRGFGCYSTKFPIGRGGAPMPYCMFFSGGYAMHGSYDVPGYNASHGCVRLTVQDAKWLNQEFVDIGTPVIISQ